MARYVCLHHRHEAFNASLEAVAGEAPFASDGPQLVCNWSGRTATACGSPLVECIWCGCTATAWVSTETERVHACDEHAERLLSESPFLPDCTGWCGGQVDYPTEPLCRACSVVVAR